MYILQVGYIGVARYYCSVCAPGFIADQARNPSCTLPSSLKVENFLHVSSIFIDFRISIVYAYMSWKKLQFFHPHQIYFKLNVTYHHNANDAENVRRTHYYFSWFFFLLFTLLSTMNIYRHLMTFNLIALKKKP